MEKAAHIYIYVYIYIYTSGLQDPSKEPRFSTASGQNAGLASMTTNSRKFSCTDARKDGVLLDASATVFQARRRSNIGRSRYVRMIERVSAYMFLSTDICAHLRTSVPACSCLDQRQTTPSYLHRVALEHFGA